MTVRQLQRVGIALVLALFLWGLSEILSGGGDVIEEVELIRAISAGEVDSVVFQRAADTVRLARTGAAWTVNGFATAPDKVAELFGATADAVTGELAAQNPASHERMGVDTATARRLRVLAGSRTVADLLIGRQGRAARTVYARRVGDDNVYLLEGELVLLIDRPVSDWRDKRILSVEPDSIARISIERAGRRYELVRADSAWTFANGTATDSAAMTRLLGELRSLSAQGTGFATPAQADSADFRRPDRRLTLRDAAGRTLGALAFDSTQSQFWVRRDGSETVYQLYRWKVEDVTPADSVMRRQEG
ncbi:MAG: DUF4340 domain-containing protein [Gemmatimonadota bacterium]|nr:DUF4340 domain-containing protein [Gemmatimonadota bacterium]